MHQRLVVYSGYICSCWGIVNTWCVRYCIGIALQGSPLATKNVPMTPFLVGCMYVNYVNDLCRHWHYSFGRSWIQAREPFQSFMSCHLVTWSPGTVTSDQLAMRVAPVKSEIMPTVAGGACAWALKASKNHVITSTQKISSINPGSLYTMSQS